MRIALTLDSDVPAEENDYVRALSDAGVRREEIVVMRPGDPIEGEFDGVVIGGGDDVDPTRYGRRILEGANVEIDHGRDAVDFPLFEEAWRTRVPVLGICRGLQVVNVARGGTLVQDLPLERPSDVAHQLPKKENQRDHPVTVEPGTRLARISGRSEIDVNSRHHQAIDRAADGFVVAAIAPDGVIEAIEARDGRWLVAVQWHPENLTDDSVSRRLFGEFVAEVRRRSSRSKTSPK